MAIDIAMFNSPLRKIALAVTAALVLLLGTCTYSILSMGSHFTNNPKSCPYPVPPNATEIKYYLGIMPNRAWDYTTTEEEWLKHIGKSETNSRLSPVEERIGIRILVTDIESDSFKKVELPGRFLYRGWSYTDQGEYHYFNTETNRAYSWIHTR